MWDYTDKVKEHFLNPRNAGEIDNADGVGEVGSMACGDALKLMIKVDDDGRIADAKFKTFGCASAIASSSALTEMIKGKTVDEALKISNKDIAAYLGGLPREKMHCSVLGEQALAAAIADLRGEKPKEAEEGEIVCECFGVTDKEIERVALANNLTTVEEVTDFTKAGGGCGQCHDKIAEILERVKAKRLPLPETAKPKKLTNIQKMRLVEETINREIRPALQADGGDLELIDIDGDTVFVSLRGACASCAASDFTMKQFVQQKLQEFVMPDMVVEEVKP
jgi:NifU-like protein